MLECPCFVERLDETVSLPSPGCWLSMGGTAPSDWMWGVLVAVDGVVGVGGAVIPSRSVSSRAHRASI